MVLYTALTFHGVKGCLTRHAHANTISSLQRTSLRASQPVNTCLTLTNNRNPDLWALVRSVQNRHDRLRTPNTTEEQHVTSPKTALPCLQRTLTD